MMPDSSQEPAEAEYVETSFDWDMEATNNSINLLAYIYLQIILGYVAIEISTINSEINFMLFSVTATWTFLILGRSA